MMMFVAFIAGLLLPSQGEAAPTRPATAAPDSALEVYAKPQTLVTLAGGRRMNLYCTGTGSPTVPLNDSM